MYVVERGILGEGVMEGYCCCRCTRGITPPSTYVLDWKPSTCLTLCAIVESVHDQHTVCPTSMVTDEGVNPYPSDVRPMVAAQSTLEWIVCWWSQDLVNNVNNSIGGRDVSERDDSTIGTDCDSSVGDSDGQLITIRCSNRVCASSKSVERSFQQQRGKAECPLGLQSLRQYRMCRDRFPAANASSLGAKTVYSVSPLSVVTRFAALRAATSAVWMVVA